MKTRVSGAQSTAHKNKRYKWKWRHEYLEFSRPPMKTGITSGNEDLGFNREGQSDTLEQNLIFWLTFHLRKSLQVIIGEKRGGQLPQKLLEKGCAVIGHDVRPVECPCVELLLQLLTQLLNKNEHCLIIIIITAVSCIVQYVTDQGEHTALYNINNNVDIKASATTKTI